MSFLNDIKNIFGTKNMKTVLSTEKPPENTLPQKKILIVEDEPLLAQALEIKFTHAGFEVFKAANGQIGLDMTQENRPDIIVLDLLMPVMDGKTMLHKLREISEFKSLPVIVLTNAGDVDNLRETKVYDNASAFLIKSNVGPNDILDIINDLI